MKNILNLLKYVSIFLEKLTSKPKVGGMQINNLGIQYVITSNGKPETYSFKFGTDVIKDGHIQNREVFLKTLQDLHLAINAKKTNQVIQVVVSVPPAIVYTQSFTVPNIDKEKLSESAVLNLRMISPMPADTTCMGWQIVSENEERYELLGAFVEKIIIEEIRGVLLEAFFHPIAFEFPALSLVRLVNKYVRLDDKLALVFQVSSDGIDVSIIYHKTLHFNYFKSWQSIQGDEKQISKELFDRTIVEEIQKIINFALSRFKENFQRVLLVAPGMENDISSLIQNNFGISVFPVLFSSGEALSPNWYIPWGSAIRGDVGLEKDSSINLNIETSSDLYYQEHVFRFVRLWRNVFVLIFTFFVLIFGVSSYFLSSQVDSLKNRLVFSKTQVDQKEYADLRLRANEFNSLVSALQNESRKVIVWEDILKLLLKLADENNVVFKRVNILSLKSPLSVVAVAADNSGVLKFKNSLESQQGFLNVSIPLFETKELSDGKIEFTATFTIDEGLLKFQ